MGCLKSKSVAVTSELVNYVSNSQISATNIQRSHSTLTPKKLTVAELDDVKYIMQTLKTENLGVFVVACVYDRLFKKYSEVKQMFLDAAFLDPDHAFDYAMDPWLQGFLKAYFHAIMKYVALQEDDEALEVFILEMRDVHQRLNGVEEKHLEFMTQSLYKEIIEVLGNNLENHHKISLKRFISLLNNSAMHFLPVRGKREDFFESSI